MSLGAVTACLVSFYLLGLIVDSLGLAIGEWKLDGWVVKEPPPEKETIAHFYKAVSEHLLKYRDLQWTYYSMYRNMFILGIPITIFVMGCLIKRDLYFWAATTVLIGMLFIVSTWVSMRTLLKLCYAITRLFVK